MTKPLADTHPDLWQGAEGGRSAAFCHYLFAAAYPHAGADAYLRWAQAGRPVAQLQEAYTRAVVNYAAHPDLPYLLRIGDRFDLSTG